MNNIRIGIFGNVDSGKSTFIGVLCSNKLDDGNGLARQKILRYQHEKMTGKTTNCSYNYVNYVEQNRVCVLIDMAGHEKYLKSTLYGAISAQLNCGVVIVGANMGLTRMTKEHLLILLFLRIPIIVLVTKTDIAPVNKYEETMRELTKTLNITMFRKHGKIYKDDMSLCLSEMETNGNIIPIIPISNKSGENIEGINYIFKNLSNHNKITHTQNLIDHPIITQCKIKGEINTDYTGNQGTITFVDKTYYVNGVGIIATGYLSQGQNSDNIKKNQTLYLGPINTTTKSANIIDKFIEIKVRSMHNTNRQEIEQTYCGNHVIMAIKPTSAKIKLTRNTFHRGIVILSNINDSNLLRKKFDVQMKILSNKAIVKRGYKPIIYCRSACQTAIVKQVHTEDQIGKTNQNVPVTIELERYPIFVQPGDMVYFRDGATKGVGVVTSINKHNTNECKKIEEDEMTVKEL